MNNHKNTNWIYWVIMILGIWMIVSPLTFNYYKNLVTPPDRVIKLPIIIRTTILFWNDIICGFLVLILGYRSLTPNRPITLWIICFIGVWLNAAPLIFWSPNYLIYLNETLIGIFIIALTVLIPGMPNMLAYMKEGPEVPPGWSFNPSSWSQRSILIVLGFLGWLVSRYLAAFQLGHNDYVWEPFFNQGSRLVLTSNMSKAFPVSDAGLGAFAYTFEFLMGFMGGPARWRTMPWMVAFFGILVIPLGLVSIFLVISQPVVVGHWCSFCLLTATIMLPMIPLEVDEVVAMIQFIRSRVRKGDKFWDVFWKGGTIEGGRQDDRSPKINTFPQHPIEILKSSFWGMSFPWNLIITSVIGLWITFSPWIFGNFKVAADIEHLSGLLTVTVSVMAMGEAIRILRYINCLLGALICFNVFFNSGINGTYSIISDLIGGVLIVVLSIPKGRINEKFHAWDLVIK